MRRFARLLCMVALAGGTALAQNADNTSLPYDASLANDSQPAATQVATQEGPAQPGGLQEQNMPSQGPAYAAKPSAARRDTSEKPASDVQASEVQASEMPPAQPRLEQRSPSSEVILPTATVLRLKLVRPVSTASARPGEQFFATLSQPVEVDGRTVIPAGTSVTCRVDAAHGGRRFAGKPLITIRAIHVQLPSGDALDFSASVIDTATPRKLDVDQEGRVRGVSANTMDKVELGSVTGAGLITGAIVAGPPGLFIGAGIAAAAAATHVYFIKHRELTLPAGTELIFELDGPATANRPQMGG